MGKHLACEQGGGWWLDRVKYFPRVLSGTWLEGCPAAPGGTWSAGWETRGHHGLLAAVCCIPASPQALPRLGVDQQMDGISSAKKQPWPQVQRARLFLTAAGVQLPQRVKKPLNGDWQWETASGEQAGSRAFACELNEAGKMASAPGSVLSAGACCTDGH